MNPARGERAPYTGRAAYSISQIYYYAAAVVGVGFIIGGAISTLIELRHLILPERSGFIPDTTRGSVHGIMVGIAFLIPGLMVAIWHLNQARRREDRFVPGQFWGKALYFHLVAFISLVTLMGGAAATLSAVADLALPPCGPRFSIEPGSSYQPLIRSCEARSEIAKNLADGIIVMIVAGGVFAWHLRETRREPPDSDAVQASSAVGSLVPPPPPAGS